MLVLVQALGFGELYTEFSCNGWVHSVAFSPSGNSLAYSGQDSTIHVVAFPSGSGKEPTHSTVVLRDLPATCLSFISDKALIAAGHDFNPFIVTGMLVYRTVTTQGRPPPVTASGGGQDRIDLAT